MLEGTVAKTLKKYKYDATKWASAMGALLNKVIEQNGGVKAPGGSKEIHEAAKAAEMRVDSVIQQLQVGFVNLLSPHIDSLDASALFAYTVAKAIGTVRALNPGDRNPVRERREIEQICEIFCGGVERQVDIIEEATLDAVAKGLFDVNQEQQQQQEETEEATEEAAAATEEEKQEGRKILLPN